MLPRNFFQVPGYKNDKFVACLQSGFIYCSGRDLAVTLTDH